MASKAGLYIRCYTFRGDGDISAATAIQARLREYGITSYFNWDPRPPRWRFFYETNLTQEEIQLALGALMTRFRISVEA
jgi:hypothetical protein